MNEQEIQDKVKKIFIEEFELEESKLTIDANIFENLGLDSLDVVDLIVALEKSFGVKINSRESLQQIRTIGDIYIFIAKERIKLNPAG